MGHVEVTLDRFEGDDAILKTTDGQELAWPEGELPEEAAEGQTYKLSLLPESGDAVGGTGSPDPKALLNEIFNTEDSQKDGA